MSASPLAAAQPAGAQDVKIRLKDVSKVFETRKGPFVSLDSITLDIPTGCFFMIVGPSGCGKTTLLRILAGLETHTSGSIEISPPPPGRPSNSMIFQGDSLFPWMTVWENAAYGLTMRRKPQGEVKEKVSHYLNRTGLLRFADHYPHQLSGGMRQRVSIARAFANDPDILLMDEPFSALDVATRESLQDELLRVWRQMGKTVIFVTHDIDEAVYLADRIVALGGKPGEVRAVRKVEIERPRRRGALAAQELAAQVKRDIAAEPAPDAEDWVI